MLTTEKGPRCKAGPFFISFPFNGKHKKSRWKTGLFNKTFKASAKIKHYENQNMLYRGITLFIKNTVGL
ncbi:hypothetical protein DXN05_08655 [Deminuibacter soli]|uniref:Uncharacterized protein n=1 Tax=Deminuibacter soli TaxID=2291815 RepID=A0A3E1NLP1_9BACT|nr:hypothetical protein DXN05_08655 [Deminuibacter soli]